jgi:hypothetical protein
VSQKTASCWVAVVAAYQRMPAVFGTHRDSISSCFDCRTALLEACQQQPQTARANKRGIVVSTDDARAAAAASQDLDFGYVAVADDTERDSAVEGVAAVVPQFKTKQLLIRNMSQQPVVLHQIDVIPDGAHVSAPPAPLPLLTGDAQEHQ